MLLPVLAAGFAMTASRVRAVPSLRLTRVDGSTAMVRTAHVMVVRTGVSQGLVQDGHPGQTMTTLWVSSNDQDLNALQTYDQFFAVLGEVFSEMHTSSGKVLVNPAMVSSITPSGLVRGTTSEDLAPTTLLTFQGGRTLLVNETPDRAAAMLGRAA
jgi:hypothetical protein